MAVRAGQPQLPTADLTALLEAGSAAVKTGRPNDALTVFSGAVPMAEGAGDEAALVRALEGLGWAQWATGKYPDALETRQRALALIVKRGDTAREAVIRRGIGGIFYAQSRFDQALEEYRRALEIPIALLPASSRTRAFEHRFDLSIAGPPRRGEGRSRGGDGTASSDWRSRSHRSGVDIPRHHQSSDRGLRTGARHYATALTAFRAAGDRRGESQVLGNLANVHLDSRQYQRAIDLNEQSLALASEIGYRAQVGFAYQNKGAAQSRLGFAREALASYQRALVVWRDLARRVQVGWTLHNAAILRVFETGELEQARSESEEALQIAREVRDPELES